MRKLPLYAMTTIAATAMAGTLTMTSQAAVQTYIITGSGAVSGNNNCITGSIGWDSWKPIKPNLPNINWPNIIFPDMDVPSVDEDFSQTPDAEVPAPPQDDAELSTFAQQVVDLVNEERGKAGLAPLVADGQVSQAAETRAREIEQVFSHTRPNGSSFSTALEELGISYRGSGENIAYGQKTPQEVMNGWMNSAGHRANILNGDFTTIGVGYHQNDAGVGYWTQLFTY